MLRAGGEAVGTSRYRGQWDSRKYLMHIVSSMETAFHSSLRSINNFVDYDVISEREGLLMKAATSDKVLGGIGAPDRDIIRASILKNMLAALMV